MAKVPTLRAGEAATANYGWVKPTVGASIDAWGGYINTDLDGIDTVVHGIDTRVIPPGVAIVSDTPPVGPTPGMLWFDSVGGQTYVWYSDANSSQWSRRQIRWAAATRRRLMLTLLSILHASTTTASSTATCGSTSATTARAGRRLGIRLIDGSIAISSWKVTWRRAHWCSALHIRISLCLAVHFIVCLYADGGRHLSFFAAHRSRYGQRFRWGTANAQPVTLSFWARSI